MPRLKANATAEADDYRRLVEQLLTARENGQTIPCLGRYAANWTSDVLADQETAMRGCLACPVLDACAKFRTTYPQPGGVWAGMPPATTKEMNR